MHLHKRGISSPAALRQSLKNRRDKLLAKIKNAESEEQASLPFEQAKATVLDEDLGDDETDEEAYYKADRNVFGSLEANKAELAELEKLLPLAEKITPAKDSKLRKLTRDFLSQAIAGYYGPAKIIIFTRYKDTLDYLEREIPRRLPESKSDIKIITVTVNSTRRNEKNGSTSSSGCKKASSSPPTASARELTSSIWPISWSITNFPGTPTAWSRGTAGSTDTARRFHRCI